MMPINKRLKRELKKNFAKYFFIGLVLFMGMTIISAFFTVPDGIMSTIEDNRYYRTYQEDCPRRSAHLPRRGRVWKIPAIAMLPH